MNTVVTNDSKNDESHEDSKRLINNNAKNFLSTLETEAVKNIQQLKRKKSPKE